MYGPKVLLRGQSEQPELCSSHTAGVTSIIMISGCRWISFHAPSYQQARSSVSCHPPRSGDLELQLLCCHGCLGISVPMHALQDFQQSFSGTQAPLGRADPPSSSCLPRRGARCVFYKGVHTRGPTCPPQTRLL